MDVIDTVKQILGTVIYSLGIGIAAILVILTVYMVISLVLILLDHWFGD